MQTPRVAALSVLIATGTLAAPAPAVAGDGVSDGIGGSCSGRATFELEVAVEDDGPLEWEFEVDSNRAGQKWRVRVVDNGRVIFSGKRRTHAPSGSFSIERRTANRSGRDHVTARAWQIRKGKRVQACVGSVTIRA